MKHPDFNEAAHPRDEKGRWAAKAAAAIKAASNSQAGKAVAQHNRSKKAALKFAGGAALTAYGASLAVHGLGHAAGYALAGAGQKALGAGLAGALGVGVYKGGLKTIKQSASNGKEHRGLSPAVVHSPPATLGHKGKNSKTQMK